MTKKNNNIIIEVILGIIVLIGIVIIAIILSKYKGYIKPIRQYICIKTTASSLIQADEQKIPTIGEKIVVDIKTDGEIESITNYSTYYYDNNDSYNDTKKYYKDKSIDAKYNDNKKTIELNNGITSLISEDGDQISLWYKTYINDIKSNDYTCTITK